MQEPLLKVHVNFSWHLVWIFAVLEGVTVPLVPLLSENGPAAKSTAHSATGAARLIPYAERMMIVGVYGMAIGFIGTLVVCLLVNHVVFRRIKAYLDNAIVIRVTHPLSIARWGGLLLAIIFWIQECVGSLLVHTSIVNLVILGCVSAGGGVVVVGFVYLLVVKKLPQAGIRIMTTEQRMLLTKVPIASLAILVGIYEGLAMPIFHIWEIVPHHKVLIALPAGFLGGALSSLIVVALAHLRIVNQRTYLNLSVLGK